MNASLIYRLHLFIEIAATLALALSRSFAPRSVAPLGVSSVRVIHKLGSAAGSPPQ